MIETNTKSKSQFVGYFGVKNVEKIERDLILPTVKNFFMLETFKLSNPSTNPPLLQI
jgi:hypothetical protein